MQTFSNCFVWVCPSTSDLKFHFCHESSGKNAHLKNTELPNTAAVLNGLVKVTLYFKTSGKGGYFLSLGEAKNIFKRLVGH